MLTQRHAGAARARRARTGRDQSVLMTGGCVRLHKKRQTTRLGTATGRARERKARQDDDPHLADSPRPRDHQREAEQCRFCARRPEVAGGTVKGRLRTGKTGIRLADVRDDVLLASIRDRSRGKAQLERSAQGAGKSAAGPGNRNRRCRRDDARGAAIGGGENRRGILFIVLLLAGLWIVLFLIKMTGRGRGLKARRTASSRP